MFAIDLVKSRTTPKRPAYVSDVLAEYLNVKFRRVALSQGRRERANPIVISVVRNENDRLPDFLRHYRERGIEKFVFIDNGSTDGTLQYLSQQHDVDLFSVARPFDWKKKHGWITLAISMYGRDRWYIYVDADEHLVFDGCDQGRTFADLATLMDSQGVARVRGFLIDMYRDGPILGSTYERGERLIEAYPFFDRAGYKEARFTEIISRKGGPRQRVFSSISKDFRPELTKYPMFRLKSYDVFANPHHIWPYGDNFVSDCLIGILHFKFLPDVLARIHKAIEEKNYWDGSLEYKCYGAAMERAPALSFHHSESARYENVETLKSLALVRSLAW